MAVRLHKSARTGPSRSASSRNYFASMLRKGDTFLIGGEIVRYEGMREMVVEVTRHPLAEAKIATFHGNEIRHLHASFPTAS